jgi:hypothetical protein
MSDKVEELEREKRGLQEMLFFVLQAVGEPVAVNKEDLHRGAQTDKMINIQDNMQTEQFVFSIVEVPNGDE